MGISKNNLEDFVRSYVDGALSLTKNEISFDDFEFTLRDSLAKKFNVPKDVIKYLYHPFHWAFFVENNGSSPFEYVQPTLKWESSKVRLKREISSEEKSELVNFILEKYANYFSEKLTIIPKEEEGLFYD